MKLLTFANRRHQVKAATILLLALLTFLAGFGLSEILEDRNNEQLVKKYNLLSRRILIENPNDVLIDFKPLENELENYIVQNNLSDKISLNFEYLPTGSSIGINETQEQVGASLLKLPLAIGVYKAAESGQIDLDQSYALKPEWLNDKYGTLYQKGAGYEITLRDAVKQALIHSDNTAALLLFETVSKAQGKSSPSLLGFIDAHYAETTTHEVLIDSRSYSAILKCLYFACHLDKEHSQELLGYLSESTAVNRLRREIPNAVTLAHKIGTFNSDTQSDCGIVYLPKRSYVLCVMIKGNDLEASNHIAELSGVTYRFLSRDSIR